MAAKTFIVTYKTFVTEGDNYAGWAGVKEFVRVIRGEQEMVKWLADVEAWNDPKLGNHPKTNIKVEVVENLVDVTAKMVKAGKAEREAEDIARRKIRAAELRAEARKVERGY
jgi:hypothetical protein